jgi:glycine/D-amino acid oxidase-like deaminating enzyme
MKIDFLLIGGGIAGLSLGYRLKKAGKTVRIFDLPLENQSSRVAAGLFNPITGRKMVKTWKADQLFPEIIPFYQELEQLTGKEFLNIQKIYRPFLSIEEQNEWMGHSADPGFAPYLDQIYNKSQSQSLFDSFGGVMLKNSGWLQIPKYLAAMSALLREELIFDHFDEEKLAKQAEQWCYDKLEFDALIYCNGLGSLNSTFFKFLPFAPVKGEILEVEQDFNPDYIVNRGVFRVGLGPNLHRVGSTYSKHDLDEGPTESAKEEILDRLKGIVNEPVRSVKSHKIGIRPATRDRKPFLGKHPTEKSVYIFNGFGAKGVSLVPYFSKLMIGYLLEKTPLESEVDIARYFNYI